MALHKINNQKLGNIQKKLFEYEDEKDKKKLKKNIKDDIKDVFNIDITKRIKKEMTGGGDDYYLNKINDIFG